MSNTFRKAYRELSDNEREHVEQIKDAAERLELFIRAIKVRPTQDVGYDQMRHVALAMTNLEQAVMWAVKAAT